MNLFRSEEHARHSPDYNPAHADTILPVATWAAMFATPMFRARSRPDFVTWLHTDAGQAARRELMGALPTSARPPEPR